MGLIEVEHYTRDGRRSRVLAGAHAHDAQGIDGNPIGRTAVYDAREVEKNAIRVDGRLNRRLDRGSE